MSNREERQPLSFPWMCSLKEAGFTGRHRCGATLLSGTGLLNNCVQLIVWYNFTGPETSEVVLVSAAHCNFVCKVILNILIADYINSLSPFRTRTKTPWRSAAAVKQIFQNPADQDIQTTPTGVPTVGEDQAFVPQSPQSWILSALRTPWLSSLNKSPLKRNLCWR